MRIRKSRFFISSSAVHFLHNLVASLSETKFCYVLKRVSSTYLPDRYEIRLNHLKPGDSPRESSFAEVVISY